MHYRWLCVVLAGMLMSSCAPYISTESLRLVSKTIPFSAVKENPDKYLGSYILVGGKVARVTNSKDGGEIEVVQLEIDEDGRPLGDVRDSAGRFLAQTGNFVDPAIYKAEQLITIVGQVKGGKVQALEAVPYTYPLLSVRELHLWKPDELYPPYRSAPPFTHYSFPYDAPYNYGVCDFGYGPYPYYDNWWGLDRCMTYEPDGLYQRPSYRRQRLHKGFLRRR